MKKEQEEFLTNEEKIAIKVLNFIATFDDIIINNDDINYLLTMGIEKFIAKKRRHLTSITKTAYPKTAYPIKIKTEK